MIKPKEIITYSYFDTICYGVEFLLDTETEIWYGYVRKLKVLSLGTNNKTGKLKCSVFHSSHKESVPLYFYPKDLYETFEEAKQVGEEKLKELNQKIKRVSNNGSR